MIESSNESKAWKQKSALVALVPSHVTSVAMDGDEEKAGFALVYSGVIVRFSYGFCLSISLPMRLTMKSER